MEKESAWNNAAKGCSQIAYMTVKYGIDSLEAVAVSPGDKMLDVGSGPGHLAVYAASEKGAIVDAIDFSSESIAILQRNLSSNPVAVTGHVMDGQQLEFPDGQFDVVSSCFGVFLFPDYMKGLSEMFRVTKPSGRVTVVAWAEMRRGAMQTWLKVFERHFPEVLPLPLPPGVAKMNNMEGMSEVLTVSGFENVEVKEVVHRVEIPDAHAFAEVGMQNPVMCTVKDRLAPERVSELVPRFVELVESEYKQGNTISFDAVGVIGCGVKPAM